MTEAAAALPELQSFPEHEGESADEDVGLHAIGALMPDGAHAQRVLLKATRRRDYQQAESLLRESLEARAVALDPSSPLLEKTRLLLGESPLPQGNLAQAESLLDSCLLVLLEQWRVARQERVLAATWSWQVPFRTGADLRRAGQSRAGRQNPNRS